MWLWFTIADLRHVAKFIVLAEKRQKMPRPRVAWALCVNGYWPQAQRAGASPESWDSQCVRTLLPWGGDPAMAARGDLYDSGCWLGGSAQQRPAVVSYTDIHNGREGCGLCISFLETVLFNASSSTRVVLLPLLMASQKLNLYTDLSGLILHKLQTSCFGKDSVEM